MAFTLKPMKLAICVALLASVALVQAASWSVVAPSAAAVLSGISCVDNSTCVIAGGDNGVGPEILKLHYGPNGVDLNRMPVNASIMMFMQVATPTATSGVVGGIGMFGIFAGSVYTQDGQTFNASINDVMQSECQSVQAIRGVKGGFGLAGLYDQVNGAAVSMDGGRTFKNIDAGLPDYTPARYGAFPSANTWYITAGQWPSTTIKKEYGQKRLTERLSVYQHPVTKKVTHKFVDPLVGRVQGNSSVYTAGIAKTTDGGRTWKTVFYQEDAFYFNAISCPSENSCFAVGESSDGPAPGGRILATKDGGATWTVQMYDPNPTLSLFDINMLNEKEGWATGGELSSNFMGHFYKTNDGGQTWEDNAVQGVYGNNLAFVPTSNGGYVGYATAFTAESSSSILRYA